MQADDLEPSHKTHDIRILSADRVRLRHEDGVLLLTVDGGESRSGVGAYRAFPLSDPGRWIGFLDDQGGDIGILPDPAGLDQESAALLDQALELRYFLPRVTRVLSVREEFGSIFWSLETTRGPVDVVVQNLKDNLAELSPTRVIITDVDGNRFEFPDITTLDAASQEIMLRNL